MAARRSAAVRIVTDSAARLPQAWAEANGVIVLPHRVIFDAHHCYREDIELSEAELAAKASQSARPFDVEAPSVEDFTRAYESLVQSRANVISIHVASPLSQAVRNALQARQPFLSRCDIHILDSRTMATGLSALVQAAITLAKRDLPAEDIVAHLRGLMQDAYGIFISDDMTYLQHSKRLRPAQALLGEMLQIVPCLSIEQGDLIAAEKVRSLEHGIERIVEFASEFDDSARFTIVQLSPHPNERTRALADALREVFPRVQRFSLQTCGAVVGRIIGPRGVGLMIYEGKV
jgi:DegV family protein with EDD domain